MKFSIVILLIVFLLIFAFLLYKVDCSIPRLSDSVLLIGAALRLCQQLKDKVHMVLWLLKEGFLGDCKIIWPSQLSWWCELATVESFYGWYFVSSFNSDKGSMLKKISIRNLGSISVSGQLLTYPSPNSTTVNWQQVKVNVELGEG